MPNASRMLFAHVVDRDDEDIELDVAALLVAEWEYERLEVAHYVDQLDRFSESVEKILRDLGNVRFGPVRAINRVLFRELGFRGNQDDYYDPRNSFLNEVIDRRTGIPISLSILYMEVARRVDIPIEGVAFPGHFLVRYDEDDDSLIIDPFRMGLTMDRDDLQSLLRRVEGQEATLSPEHLQPVSKKSLLMRLLTNLAAIYSKHRDALRSVEVLERMRILDPQNSRVERALSRLRAQAIEVN